VCIYKSVDAAVAFGLLPDPVPTTLRPHVGRVDATEELFAWAFCSNLPAMCGVGQQPSGGGGTRSCAFVDAGQEDFDAEAVEHQNRVRPFEGFLAPAGFGDERDLSRLFSLNALTRAKRASPA